jgi:tetratricopeptide repeat protein 21B
MMLADIMLRKDQFEAAIYHFQQLLDLRAANFAALARLIALLRRAGRLGDAPKYIRKAERSAARVATEPGFCYCKVCCFLILTLNRLFIVI